MKVLNSLSSVVFILVFVVSSVSCGPIKENLAAQSYDKGAELASQGQFDLALEAYSKAIEQNPAYAAAYFARGQLYFDLEEYNLASQDLEQAIQFDLQQADAYYLLGLAYLELGKQDQALESFTQALTHDSNHTDACYQRGLIYLRQSETDKAFDDFNQAIHLGIQSADAYYQRALINIDHGDTSNALTDLNRALQLDDGIPGAYYQRGFLNAQAGDHRAAIDDFGQAIQQQPELEEGYFHRAQSYTEIGKIDEAIGDLEKVIEINPQNADAYFNLGIHFSELEDLESAKANFSKVIQIDENAVDAYYERGHIHYRQGNLDQSVADLEVVRSFDPEYEQISALLGQVYLETQDYENAVAMLDQAISLEPDELRFYSQRAYANHHLGNLDKAVEDYNVGVRKQNNSGTLRYNLGLAYAQNGDLSEAYYQISKSIEIEPTAEAYHLRAHLNFERFDLESATKDLESALSVEPDFHMIHLQLSQFAFLEGDLALSIERMREFLIADSQSEHAADAKAWISGLEAEMEGEPTLDLDDAELTLGDIDGMWMENYTHSVDKELEEMLASETASLLSMFSYESASETIECTIFRVPTLESQMQFGLASIISIPEDALSTEIDNLGLWSIAFREPEMAMIIFQRGMAIVFMWVYYHDTGDVTDFTFDGMDERVADAMLMSSLPSDLAYSMDEIIMDAFVSTLPFSIGEDYIQTLPPILIP